MRVYSLGTSFPQAFPDQGFTLLGEIGLLTDILVVTITDYIEDLIEEQRSRVKAG